MTGSIEDDPEWRMHISNTKQRRDVANEIKDAKNPFQIGIVLDTRTGELRLSDSE